MEQDKRIIPETSAPVADLPPRHIYEGAAAEVVDLLQRGEREIYTVDTSSDRMSMWRVTVGNPSAAGDPHVIGRVHTIATLQQRIATFTESSQGTRSDQKHLLKLQKSLHHHLNRLYEMTGTVFEQAQPIDLEGDHHIQSGSPAEKKQVPAWKRTLVAAALGISSILTPLFTPDSHAQEPVPGEVTGRGIHQKTDLGDISQMSDEEVLSVIEADGVYFGTVVVDDSNIIRVYDSQVFSKGDLVQQIFVSEGGKVMKIQLSLGNNETGARTVNTIHSSWGDKNTFDKDDFYEKIIKPMMEVHFAYNHNLPPQIHEIRNVVFSNLDGDFAVKAMVHFMNGQQEDLISCIPPDKQTFIVMNADSAVRHNDIAAQNRNVVEILRIYAHEYIGHGGIVPFSMWIQGQEPVAEAMMHMLLEDIVASKLPDLLNEYRAQRGTLFDNFSRDFVREFGQNNQLLIDAQGGYHKFFLFLDMFLRASQGMNKEAFLQQFIRELSALRTSNPGCNTVEGIGEEIYHQAIVAAASPENRKLLMDNMDQEIGLFLARMYLEYPEEQVESPHYPDAYLANRLSPKVNDSLSFHPDAPLYRQHQGYYDLPQRQGNWLRLQGLWAETIPGWLHRDKQVRLGEGKGDINIYVYDHVNNRVFFVPPGTDIDAFGDALTAFFFAGESPERPQTQFRRFPMDLPFITFVPTVQSDVVTTSAGQ